MNGGFFVRERHFIVEDLALFLAHILEQTPSTVPGDRKEELIVGGEAHLGHCQAVA